MLCRNCGTENGVAEGSLNATCGSCAALLPKPIGNVVAVPRPLIYLLAAGLPIAGLLYWANQPGRPRQVRPAAVSTADPQKNPFADLFPETPAQPREVSPELRPVPVSTGVVRQPFGTPDAPFGITASADANYYVKLVDMTGRTVMTIFLERGRYFETNVPLGRYHLRYAAGDIWYGEKALFGPDTSYAMADETFDFTFDGDRYSGYKVGLIMQRNGNLRTTPLSPESF